MNEPEVPQKQWGCVQWSVAMVVTALLLFSGAIYIHNLRFRQANQVAMTGRVRDIIGLCLNWASDNNGFYPDRALQGNSATSNEAFRRLFVDELTLDESIFGCLYSPFQPDREIGQTPDFTKALRPGENHWMLVAGMTKESPAHFPLVLENAAQASWPPTWRIDQREQFVRGRAWGDGSILIGFNDASVRVIRLDEQVNNLHLPITVLKPEGKPPLPVMKILDIAVK